MIPLVAEWLHLLSLVSVSPASVVGRWDLTVADGERRYPSWFEVVQGSDSLAGRFQGEFGHATEIVGIVVDGSRFRFAWPSEDAPAATATRVEGTIRGGRYLSGVITEPSGKRHHFQAVRAPALAGAASTRWGQPVLLLAGGLATWRVRHPKDRNGWKFENGEIVNSPPSADLITKRTFSDFKLHVEVNVPPKGNSGIYLRGRYEVQVQDDFGKEPFSRRMGGVYGQVTPTTLPAKPAGEWQVFDITMIGRRVTVVLNGVTIIDGQEIPGITGGALDSREGDPGPIMLQGDHSGIRYRNIVVQPAVQR